MTEPINQVDVNQADYMKLFMQELTYQDPLKPVDNREFMAQMAQFSAVQQTGEINDKLDKLINLIYGNFATNIFNSRRELYVTFDNSDSASTVEGIRFNQEGKAELRVVMPNGGDSNPWIGIDRVTQIDPKGGY